MEFFTYLEDILQTSNPHKKIEKFKRFYTSYKEDKLSFNHSLESKIFTFASFEKFCKVVLATKVPRRRSLKTDKDRAILVHSIAHIEYSAIDLALDHSYRFKNMPKEFYDDWLEVADEEIHHFLLLEKILLDLGFRYGDFEVHKFLFDISMKTLNLIDRMAVVPRYLEASGLDANPKIIQRVEKLNDNFSKNLKNTLTIILNEEITHVKKGDKWFKWACQQQNIPTSLFFEIVERYLPGACKKKEYVNVEFRKKAGYSCQEIEVLAKESVCE